MSKIKYEGKGFFCVIKLFGFEEEMKQEYEDRYVETKIFVNKTTDFDDLAKNIHKDYVIDISPED